VAHKIENNETLMVRLAFPDIFSKLGKLPEWNVPGVGLLWDELLHTAIACCSCLASRMFGHDHGVISWLLTLDNFQRHFPLMTPLSQTTDLCWTNSPTNTIRNERMCTGDANTQATAFAPCRVGCFLGAVLILFYGEVCNRRSSTFWGSFIMIIGTIFPVAAGGINGGDIGAYTVLIVGRVVGDIGNGMVTSSKSPHSQANFVWYQLTVQTAVPTRQSEFAKPEKRGKLIITSGAIIVAGIMISYWVRYEFYFLPTGQSYSSVRWRFLVAFQAFFTVLVM
jgi:hypothetical protein